MRSRALGNILRISRCCHLYRRRALRDTDLNPAQHLLLSHVCLRPGLAQEGLAGTLYLDKTTVTHQLNKLEDMGYIRRESAPEDGRCRLIYPTEKGEKVYPRVHAVFESFTAGLLEGLSEADRDELERLMELLCRNATRMTEEKQGGEPG